MSLEELNFTNAKKALKQLQQGVNVLAKDVVGMENIKPKAINWAQTNFLSSENLFVYETAKKDTTLTDVGAEYPSVQYDTSNFIPVTAGLSYSISKGSRHVMFYNSSKTYASTITSVARQNDSYTFTAPATGFIRVAIYKGYSLDFTVVQSSTLTEIGREVKIIQPLVSTIDNGAIVDKTIDYVKTDFLEVGKNLFNKDSVVLDSLLSDTGGTVTASSYITSNNYIRLKKGISYTLSPVRAYSLYTLSKRHYKYINTGDNNAEITITPTQECLIRVSMHSTKVDSFQIEEGNIRTAYERFNYKIRGLRLEQVENPIGDIQIVKNGENFSLVGTFGDSEEITVNTSRNGSHNGSFNFEGTTIGGNFLHDTTDDITPIRTFYTVGANHGYFCTEITASGKTTADVGSIWTDGTNEWTLVKVVGDVLTLIPDYKETSGVYSAVTLSNPTTDLTHVSGATNTASISVVSASSEQLYPSINEIAVKYILDGEEITEDGDYYGEELQIKENYNIMDYQSIVDWSQANVGQTYTNGNIEGSAKISNTFTYRKGLKCTTSHSLKVLKKISVGKCGFLQSVPLDLSGYTRKRFMPNVTVKEGMDFPNGVDLDAYNTSLNFYNADLINSTIPPSHYVDWLYDGSSNKKYGFSLGYIVDKTNSKNADRVANATSYWDMRNTKKSYPVAIEGMTLQAGEYLSFMGFRNYLSPNDVGEATNLSIVQDKKDLYVYAVLNQDVTGFNKELNGHIGKSITLVQGENFTLLNEAVDSEGAVFSVSNGVGNGILKVN
jgi:hypothetical protein